MLLSTLTACQSGLGSDVLVQMGESRLTLREVLEVMPPRTTGADSAAFVQEYMDRWIDEELVYQQGVRNLANYRELMQQVEEYKRILVSQTYDRELLRRHEQELSLEDCEAFYNQYGKQMKLKEPIIKGFYIKVHPDAKTHHKKLREWLKKLQEGETEEIDAMEHYLQIHAVDYDGFLEQWQPLDFVAKRLPVPVVDAASFLKLQVTVLEEEDYSYLLLLTDYRLDGEQTPLEYAMPEIRETLLNQRSREYLEQSHKEMRKRAIETGKLIINTTDNK